MWGWRTTVRSARPDWSSVWKRLLRLILPKAPRDSLKEIIYDLEPCTETPWQGLHALNGDKTKHCSGQNQNRRSSPYHHQHHQAVHLAVGQVGLPEPRRVPLFQVLEDKTVPHQEGDSPKQLCWRGRLVNVPCLFFSVHLWLLSMRRHPCPLFFCRSETSWHSLWPLWLISCCRWRQSTPLSRCPVLPSVGQQLTKIGNFVD